MSANGLGPPAAGAGQGQGEHRSESVLSLELDADPYDPDEEDPAQSRALESSLWELQVRPGRPVPSRPVPSPHTAHLPPHPHVPVPSLSPWFPGGTLTSVGIRHSVPNVGCWEASQPRG